MQVKNRILVTTFLLSSLLSTTVTNTHGLKATALLKDVQKVDFLASLQKLFFTKDSIKFSALCFPFYHMASTYKSNKPFIGQNRCSLKICLQAYKECTSLNKTKTALATILSQIKYFYIDGICGHPETKPKKQKNSCHHCHSHDDVSKAHARTTIPARGIGGMLGSTIAPLLKPISKVAKILKTYAAFGTAGTALELVLEVGDIWKEKEESKCGGHDD